MNKVYQVQVADSAGNPFTLETWATLPEALEHHNAVRGSWIRQRVRVKQKSPNQFYQDIISAWVRRGIETRLYDFMGALKALVQAEGLPRVQAMFYQDMDEVLDLVAYRINRIA